MAKVTNFANALSTPAWAGDFFDRDHMIPGGARLDAAAFMAIAHTITTTANAALGATVLAVSPVTAPIPRGTVLGFGAGPTNVTVSVDTPLGATFLPIAAASAAIASGTTAPYTPTAAVPVTVPSGYIVGRTIAERDAGTPFGPAGAADDEVYIICFDVEDVLEHQDIELYRPNSIVKETFLPGYAAVAAGVKTKLRAAYVCTVGAP